jgi:hypothetical protein
MTVVPLPASPCVKVRLDYLNSDNSLAGSRFYLGYTGAAPSAANLDTLATDIAGFWETDFSPLVSTNWSLRAVDIIDIASEAGASGAWAGTNNGADSSGPLPSQIATNVEYDISRRYRGGKPRMYLPAPGSDKLETPATWTTGFLTAVNSACSAFFTAIEALSIGAMGTLSHVNLSYYKGFTNVPNSSGRERAVPTYRSAALVDSVTGYSAKGLLSSQRRRRAATTY